MKSDELAERKKMCIWSPQRQEPLPSAAEQY